MAAIALDSPMMRLAWVCLAGAGWPILTGCGGSQAGDLNKAVQQATQAAQQIQDTAAQATGLSSGSVELTLDAPLKVETCIARFTPKTAERPGVLQLTTCEDPAKEEFPSVLLWATTDVGVSTELVGQTLQGHLFVQTTRDGGLWSSPTLQPVSIKVTQADLLAITCEVQAAAVHRDDGEANVQASGKFVGLWK